MIKLVEDIQSDKIEFLKQIIKLQEKQLLMITEDLHKRIDKLEQKINEK